MGIVLNWSSGYDGSSASVDDTTTNFPTLVDGVHDVLSSHVNELANAVVQIQTIQVSLSPLTTQDEGATLTSETQLLNFTGAGVTATNFGGNVTVNIPGSSGGDVQIEDEGTPITAAVTHMDFVGAGVTATNVGASVTVTIPGGSGSLQQAYDGGNTIDVNTVSPISIVRNDGSGNNNAIDVLMNSGAPGALGSGLSVQMLPNCFSPAINISHSGPSGFFPGAIEVNCSQGVPGFSLGYFSANNSFEILKDPLDPWYRLRTQDTVGTNSQGVYLMSGSSSAANAGQVRVLGGSGSTGGGAVWLRGGDSGAGQAGGVQIDPGAGATAGNVTIMTAAGSSAGSVIELGNNTYWPQINMDGYVVLDNNSTTASNAVTISKAPASLTIGHVIDISCNANVSGFPINIDNNSPGASIYISDDFGDVSISGGSIVTGGGNLSFQALAGEIYLNETGNTTLLPGFEATSIVGALNELYVGDDEFVVGIDDIDETISAFNLAWEDESVTPGTYTVSPNFTTGGLSGSGVLKLSVDVAQDIKLWREGWRVFARQNPVFEFRFMGDVTLNTTWQIGLSEKSTPNIFIYLSKQDGTDMSFNINDTSGLVTHTFTPAALIARQAYTARIVVSPTHIQLFLKVDTQPFALITSQAYVFAPDSLLVPYISLSGSFGDVWLDYIKWKFERFA